MQDPLIILAAPRSFTSVVSAMLGQHPQMYALLEVNLFAAETMRERERIVTEPAWSEHGLLRAVAELFYGKQTAQTITLAQQWLDVRANASCVSVFRELAQKVSPRLLVDKSPRTVLRPEYLQRARRAFPNANYLHLTRHPRAQCESLMKVGGRWTAIAMGALDYNTDPPTIDYQEAWYRMNINIVTFLADVPKDRWRRVKGEDLLADPNLYFREIAAWLGLSTNTQAIEAMKHPERSPFATLGPLNAPFGGDPGFLRSPVLRRPEDVVEPPKLQGTLKWRLDGGAFSPEVKELARQFGYQ